MKSDPTDPQGRQTVMIGDLPLTIETPPDLDALLDHAAAEHPQAVDAIPYYAILWPSAIGLARYLWRIRDELAGHPMIELGCGLGLPSILLAKLGFAVTATDFHPDTGQWLNHNAALNGVEVAYRPLDWEDLLRDTGDVFDLPPRSALPGVIGSDLLYERRHIPALIHTIGRLCASGTAIIADPGRDALDLFVMGMEQVGWRHTLIASDDIYVCRFDRPKQEE